MKTIKVESDGGRNYKVFSGEKEMATITYPKWYSYAAELDVNGSRYTIKNRGFWGTVQEVRKGDRILLEGRYKWKGMELRRPGGQPYLLKPKGIWGGTYILLDHAGNELMALTSEVRWKSFRSTYTITCADSFGADEFEMLLLLASIHFHKMYQSMSASTGAATTSNVG